MAVMLRQALFTLVAALALAGCSDDPPSIRMLVYSPNAASQGVMASISGTVNYSDPDGDISQSQFDLVAPSGMAQTSSLVPISDVTQGPLGMVDFTINFTPMEVGLYHFDVWIVDLQGRESNRLQGPIRVSPP
jgi:hypothetical protein